MEKVIEKDTSGLSPKSMQILIDVLKRFENYKKVLLNLQEALALKEQRKLTKLEMFGFIREFEFTYELAWKTMKDYLEFQGITGIIGSRDAFRNAFQNGLIEQGGIWQEMIDDRNLLSHNYDEIIAEQVADRISGYAKLLVKFRDKMQAIG